MGKGEIVAVMHDMKASPLKIVTWTCTGPGCDGERACRLILPEREGPPEYCPYDNHLVTWRHLPRGKYNKR